MHTTVKIHAYTDVLAHRIPYGRHIRQHRIDLGVAVDELQLLAGIHLHRTETPRHRVSRRVGGIRRTIATNPGIHTDALAHPATEQLADRHAERLALDVPQRLIDAGNGTHEDRPAAIEAAAIHDRPEVFDVARVLAD